MTKKYTCPCCGYNELDTQPYEKEINLPVEAQLLIPYSKHFGEPSYDVCDCCGYEYGNDDEPGTAPGLTFQNYLKEWIDEGCKWLNEEKKPAHWSLEKQLKDSGIKKGV